MSGNSLFFKDLSSFPSNAATVTYFLQDNCHTENALCSCHVLCSMHSLFSDMPPGSIICLILNKITEFTNYSFIPALPAKKVELAGRKGRGLECVGLLH